MPLYLVERFDTLTKLEHLVGYQVGSVSKELIVGDATPNGKLKTYDTNKSFMEIYWCHSSLKEGQYYLITDAPKERR